MLIYARIVLGIILLASFIQVVFGTWTLVMSSSAAGVTNDATLSAFAGWAKAASAVGIIFGLLFGYLAYDNFMDVTKCAAKLG